MRDGGKEARRAKLESELQRMLGLLVARGVERVILFGSLAAGKVYSDTDIDLIVVERTDKRFMDRLDELYRYLLPRCALDLLVYTPEEFEYLSKNRAFVRRAVETGKVLHAP